MTLSLTETTPSLSRTTTACSHCDDLENQYSGLGYKLLKGCCSDIMNVFKTRLHVKGIWGEKWSSLDLNIFPSAPENCFCFGPSTWYLFANHKESQRSTECPLRLCTVSAAVIAAIGLKSMMHIYQLSSCHLKARKAKVKKENLFLLDTFQVATMAKHWSGTEVRGVNSGKQVTVWKSIFSKRVPQKYSESPVRM